MNADVEMIKNSIDDELQYSDTVFAGSMGMMTREWAGDLKQTEQLEYNRLRRTGGVFENYVTEGDGLRQAAASREPVYDVSGTNANKQADHFRRLTEEFLGVCS